jgi:proteasome assembly chaperone (PAC2) family protein
MNGLVIGMANLKGMEGMCLLGETSGYMIDPAASQRVLEALSRLLKLRIDLSSLTERAAEAKELMGQIQKMAATGQEGEVESGAFRQGGSSRQPGYIG